MKNNQESNELVIACATNDHNRLAHSHFGDSCCFQIFKLLPGKATFVHEIVNPLHNGEDPKNHPHHGDNNKAEKIISLFEQQKVDVFVSGQFGENINKIKNHVLPVIIRGDVTIDKALVKCQTHFNELSETSRLSGLLRKYLVLS